METIKQRAHRYAIAHQHKADGISLMRAYVAGAESDRKINKTKVFISGQVSGLEYYVAYGNFSYADRQLSSMGYQVINPMKICRKNWSWVRCMIKCLWAIIFCHKIYQLDNWKESRGARIEYRWAKLLNKTFL